MFRNIAKRLPIGIGNTEGSWFASIATIATQANNQLMQQEVRDSSGASSWVVQSTKEARGSQEFKKQLYQSIFDHLTKQQRQKQLGFDRYLSTIPIDTAQSEQMYSSVNKQQVLKSMGAPIDSESVAPGALGSILQGLYVQDLKQELRELGNNVHYLKEKDFIQLCIKCNAARTPESALKVCEALGLAGDVIRVPMAKSENIYFLHPDDLQQRILKAIPDTEGELDEMCSERKYFINMIEEIQNQSSRRAQVAIHAILIAGVGQWLWFMYLTFYQLSWEVMEPITYFVNHAFLLLSLAYYILFQQDFAYQSMHTQLKKVFQARTIKDKGITEEQFQRLLNDASRFRRHIQKMRF